MNITLTGLFVMSESSTEARHPGPASPSLSIKELSSYGCDSSSAKRPRPSSRQATVGESKSQSSAVMPRSSDLCGLVLSTELPRNFVAGGIGLDDARDSTDAVVSIGE